MYRPLRHAVGHVRTPHPAALTPYDRAGQNYTDYADGNSEQPFAFDGLHAYADKCVWKRLDEKLRRLKASGQCSIRILDAGCGPGTWLRRVVAHAHWLGFEKIEARGFDIARLQVTEARKKSRALARLPEVSLVFELGDLTRPLPEADQCVDISLCLYSVLSHLPRETLPAVVAELARVTRGHLFTTVRAVGSTPTIFVDSIDKARSFRQDHRHDRCTVELSNGARFEIPSHLFAAEEFRTHFARVFDIEELCGLDLFHGRFAPDRRWNPETLPTDKDLDAELTRLEEIYSHDEHLRDRANHLFLIGRARKAGKRAGNQLATDTNRR